MLKYKLSEFKLCKPDVLRQYEEGGIDQVKLMCVYANIPLLVALSFVQQVEDSERVKEELTSLKDFYKAEVVG